MTKQLKKYIHHIDLVWGLVLNHSASVEWAREESIRALNEYIEANEVPINNLSVEDFKTQIKAAYNQGKNDYANFDYYATDSEDYFRKKYGKK